MYAVNQYDAVAESYDSLFKDKASIEENRKIASMLFEVSGIFLDVGCGTGLLLDILKVSPDEYWGIDPSSKMLDVFRKKHPEYNNLCIPFELLNLKFATFNSIVALFGKENYHPVTYKRTGRNLEHYSHSRSELEERFPHCEVREFDNYYIVTNV